MPVPWVADESELVVGGEFFGVFVSYLCGDGVVAVYPAGFVGSVAVECVYYACSCYSVVPDEYEFFGVGYYHVLCFCEVPAVAVGAAVCSDLYPTFGQYGLFDVCCASFGVSLFVLTHDFAGFVW